MKACNENAFRRVAAILDCHRSQQLTGSPVVNHHTHYLAGESGKKAGLFIPRT